MKILTIIALILSFALCSCDPAIGVAIQNKTSTNKSIKVIYPANFKLPSDSIPFDFCIRDSVRLFNLKDEEYYLHPTVIPKTDWDTAARTYSFNLPPNYEAIVEQRFLTALPTFGQVFIIDGTDTIKLMRRGRDFIKRPKLLLGGTWSHTIKDKQ